MRLDHVQLSIPRGGEDEARRFWVGVLGLVEVPKPAALAARGGAWFSGGELAVHVGVEEGFAPARKAHPAIAVDDVEAVAAALSGAGFDVRWAEDIPGVRRFHTDDPFGNRVEITQPQPTR